MKKHYSNKKLARKPLITALEPRLLLDGAAVATAVDVITDAQLQQEAVHKAVGEDVSQSDSVHRDCTYGTSPTGSGQKLWQKKEVVFIDSNVTDYQTLLNGMKEGVEVVLLDGSKDGLAQMADWAQGKSDYDAIHILSHGAEGQVSLGGFSLNNSTVHTRSADLAQLGAALNEDGDLLLYGCKVASGEGQDFISCLSPSHPSGCGGVG